MALLNIDVPAGWTVVAGKAQVRKVIGAAGNEVAARARAIIRGGDRKHASEPGEPPHSVSGKLARSIRSRTRRDGEGATIRASEFYALFLSLGARGGGGNTHSKANILPAFETRFVKGYWKVLRGQNRMKAGAVSKTRKLLPRPFLGPALDQVIANGLADRVRAAITSGLKFERGKKN